MDVVVKKSKIEGKGVFAARDFKKGEVVIKWNLLHQLTKDEAKKLSEKEKKYLAHIDGKIIVQQSPAKYVNESCNPNTHVKNFCDVALRNIKKGEEITSDFSSNLGPGETMKCNCGSKNCRKIIIGK
ncbi:SET domain-containing protein-lysine N-methyltransferase [Candidatus Micrarchaeota archaeon]|nr:SET domain-containing protein-lysine N-methyltransferase [Candidatus Micrarchaeota archaeon]